MESIKGLMEILQKKDFSEILIAIIIFIVFFLGSSFLSKVICKIFRVRKLKSQEIAIYKNLKLIFKVTGLYLGIWFLQLPIGFMSTFTKIIKIINIILITKLVADCINPRTIFVKKMVQDNPKNESSINFIYKILKGLIYVIGVFVIITELGYDISGIITGLGLGGVVLALAAQDIAKNLFAGFAVLTDKTFVVGDYIETNQVSGTIEDISFRTTRIRTMDNSLVTVPNSILADGQVMNWSKNFKRKYEFNLRFKLDSNITVLKEMSNRIRFVLKTNKDIIPDDIHINFTEILEDSIKLNIYFYTTIVNYSDFLEFKSDINMIILSMLEKEGIKLAYPTQSIVHG